MDHQNKTEELEQRILELENQNQELCDEKDRYIGLLNLVNSCVCEIDMDFKFTFVNDNGLKMFGYDKDDVKNGATISDIVPKEQKPIFLERIQQLLDGQKTKPITYKLLSKSGDLHTVKLNTVSFTKNGKIAGFRTIINDLSDKLKNIEEIKNLEKQVLYAQKLESIGLMAGGLAHDFNNLLVPVVGNADLLLDLLPRTSKFRSNIEKIKSAAVRASELTQQMLAYTGKSIFCITSVDINNLLLEMKSLLDVSISPKVSFNLDLNNKIPTCQCDPSQIRQVTLNLITNAAESIGNNEGTITLRTGTRLFSEEELPQYILGDKIKAGAFLYFTVSDTGCGMEKETIDKIFDPFFTTKFTGRGLGMAAVIGIIKGHDGAINVESELLKGTSVTIILPLEDISPLKLKHQTDENLKIIQDGIILLIDDDEDVIAITRAILEEKGFAVLTASSGEEGLMVFKQYLDEIDIVLMDITMPKLSGTELFKIMHNLKSEIPVVLMSGYNESDLLKNMSLKPACFLQKPFQMRQLLKAVVCAFPKH
jgi:PAS domain S-box-containing protein